MLGVFDDALYQRSKQSCWSSWARKRRGRSSRAHYCDTQSESLILVASWPVTKGLNMGERGVNPASLVQCRLRAWWAFHLLPFATVLQYPFRIPTSYPPEEMRSLASEAKVI